MIKFFMDVKFDDVTKNEVSSTFKLWLEDAKQHYVVTPGPEFVVRAWEEPMFRSILNQADLSTCDGFGLKIVGSGIKNKITGMDLIDIVSELCASSNKKILLLGGTETITKEASKNLQKKIPNLIIAGSIAGPFYNVYENKLELSTGDIKKEAQVFNEINKTEPDVIIVGFGAGKQEKWVYKNLSKFKTVKIAICVGGALDIIGGKFKRAPKIFLKLQLEWFWRLIIEPLRIKRITTALFTFPLLYLKFIFHCKKSVLYKSMGVILNKDKKILVMNNRKFKDSHGEDHWQIPQGTMEAGESPEQTLLREIEEETGLKNCSILYKSKINHFYFHPMYFTTSKSVVRIFYLLCENANELHKTNEACDFKWVSIDDLTNNLHTVRKPLALQISQELKELLNNGKIVV